MSRLKACEKTEGTLEGRREEGKTYLSPWRVFSEKSQRTSPPEKKKRTRSSFRDGKIKKGNRPLDGGKKSSFLLGNARPQRRTTHQGTRRYKKETAMLPVSAQLFRLLLGEKGGKRLRGKRGEVSLRGGKKDLLATKKRPT